MLGIAEPEPFGDLPVRFTGCGGGQCHSRYTGETLGQIPEREIVGPEVMTPLRHAMRLVDRDDTERAALEQLRGLRPRQSFGSHVQKIELPCQISILDLATFLRRLGRIEVGRAHTTGPQRIDLVVHERDERTDHQPRALPDQRRHLVGDGLTATGRHEHDRVAPADHLLDDRRLVAPERVVSEYGPQRLDRRPEPRGRRRLRQFPRLPPSLVGWWHVVVLVRRHVIKKRHVHIRIGNTRRHPPTLSATTTFPVVVATTSPAWPLTAPTCWFLIQPA